MHHPSNPSFVQVSINSQKLNDYLTNIQSLIKKQQLKIQGINTKLSMRLDQMNENTQKLEAEMKKSDKQIKQMVVQEILIQKDELRKTNQKIEHLFEDLNQRISQVNSQANQEKQKLQQVLNKAAFAFQESKQIRTLKNSISNLEKQIDQVKSDSFKKMLEEYVNQAHEEKVTEICQINFFKILENDRVRQIICNRDYLSPGGQDKTQKKENLTQKEAVFYASVSDKIQNLEKRLSERSNLADLNKVLYPSKNGGNWTGTSSGFNSTKNSSCELSKEEIEQIVSRIVSFKIDALEQNFNNKLSELKTELKSQFSQKCQLLAQKHSILTKKLQKERSRINDLVLDLKKHTEKKVDQKLIQTFRYEIRQKALDYQDNLDSKIGRDMYEKDKSKLNERIKIIHENLTQKSDKVQIKKAIQFLQGKIKQIILLVAGSFDEDRTGSIKKTPFKCLSCDKDLDAKLLSLKENVVGENGQGDGIKSLKRSESSLKLRCSTSRMRNHFRLNSGTVTPAAYSQTASFGLD